MIFNGKYCPRNTLDPAFDCPWKDRIVELLQTVFQELFYYICNN